MTSQKIFPHAFDKFIPPIFLAGSLMVVYLKTLAPGLTWANNGSDGGDLIAAAATGGVAHPTGYPVYLFLARGFQLIPIGSLAFRTNLMSAVAAILASVVVYVLVTNFLLFQNPDKKNHWLAGLISAYAFGLSPLVWSQAVITEVYTLHALFAAFILYLLSDSALLKLGRKNLDRALGLIFGLAMGNHVTFILILPIVIFSEIFLPLPAGGCKFDKQSFLRRSAWIAAGMLMYLSLPLRAFSRPPVNWGDPLSPSGFKWLVTGELYQDQFFALTQALVLERMRASAGLLIEQFGIPGLIIGLIGAIVFYKPSQLYRHLIWVFSAFSIFAIGYATSDSYVYLIPAFLCFAIWVGLGAYGLLELFSKNSQPMRNALGLIFLLYLFLLAGSHWGQVDASRDMRAESFGEDVLAQAAQNAIIFAKGDKAIFTMWYFRHALQHRTDIVIIAPDLLNFNWYQETLRLTYPGIKIPNHNLSSELIARANPDRAICHIEYDQTALINCLPTGDDGIP